jgi:hypothetical protein
MQEEEKFRIFKVNLLKAERAAKKGKKPNDGNEKLHNSFVSSA